ncbi:MAG TPA: valine--tRNA ligase, partial [Rhodospirillaceae bacterium]|nr:valine--tRNA ligase [Rhodospirillaceae bacterium]
NEMEWLVRFISAIRAVRAEMNVPPSARLALLVKGASPLTKARLELHRAIILTLARGETLESVDEAPAKGAVQVVVDEATVALPLTGIVDLEQEKARLTKEIGKLAQEIDKVDKRLGNDGFVAKAPPEVVEEQRERRQEWVTARARLTEALARIAAI